LAERKHDDVYTNKDYSTRWPESEAKKIQKRNKDYELKVIRANLKKKSGGIL